MASGLSTFEMAILLLSSILRHCERSEAIY